MRSRPQAKARDLELPRHAESRVENLPAVGDDFERREGIMTIRSNGLDSADYRRRQAHDVDENDGLQAWSSGLKTIANSPNDPYMRIVGSDVGPREIPAAGPALTDQDRADLESGKAVLAYRHDEQLTDRDRALIAEGKGIVLPMPISEDRAGSLTADELRKISTGEATLVPASSAPAPTEFRKGADGRLQIPQDRLHEALDRGIVSIEDIASGKVQVG